MTILFYIMLICLRLTTCELFDYSQNIYGSVTYTHTHTHSTSKKFNPFKLTGIFIHSGFTMYQLQHFLYVVPHFNV